jgi:Tol biopolymer transport system component
LWALPFGAGKVQGPPELLRPDIGSAESAGITNAGALFVRKAISTRDVAVARIDIADGRLTGAPHSFTQGFSDDPRGPVWSPDGKRLAYSIEDGRTIAIRTVATGERQLLPRTLAYVPAVDWSPDGRSLLTRTGAADLKGRGGVFILDAETGDMTTVVLGAVGAAQWSRDGKSVYYLTSGASGSLVKRDLASGAETVVLSPFRADRGANMQFFALSPDGRHFAFQGIDRAAGTSTLFVVPAAGGAPRELLVVSRPEELWSLAWTPDSNAVLVIRNTAGEVLRRSHQELWSAPLNGPPQRLAIDPGLWTTGASAPWTETFSISPDGRQIAFVMGQTEDEMWALENFLPSPVRK